MSITVVTVTLNAEADLALTLESALQQDHPDLNVIVVDGYSWDGTHRVLELYRSDLAKVVEQEDAGIFFAMNAAVTEVESDYMLFLNAGDRFWRRDAVSALWARRLADPDVIYGDSLCEGVDGVTRIRRTLPFDTVMRRVRSGRLSANWLDIFPCHQSILVRTALLRRMPYDTRFAIAADHDHLMRAAAEGARIEYADEIVSVFRAGGMSARRPQRTADEVAAAYRRHSLAPALTDESWLGEANRAFPGGPAVGAAVFGLGPNERPDGESRAHHRVEGDLVRLVSPSGTASKGFALRGHNETAPVTVRLASAEGEIAEPRTVPGGPFDLTFDLNGELAPATLVDLVIDGPPDGTQPSLVVHELAFVPLFADDAAPLAPGRRIAFVLDNQDEAAAFLGAGWSQIERSHVWSVRRTAQLTFRPTERFERMTLVISKNPFISEDQEVSLVLNGRPIALTTLASSASRVAIEAETASSLRPGQSNVLDVKVAALKRPPNDARTLGVALHELSTAAVGDRV